MVQAENHPDPIDSYRLYVASFTVFTQLFCFEFIVKVVKALLFCLLGFTAEAPNDVFLSNDLKRLGYRNAIKALRVNFGSRYKIHFVFLGIVLGVCVVCFTWQVFLRIDKPVHISQGFAT